MDDEPAGVPEWVVTYGDMMSLLLTFFIMLVSLSEVVADEKYRAVMAALHNYLGYSMAPAAPAGKNYPLNSLVQRMESLGAFRDDVPKPRRGTGGVRIKAPQGTHLRVFRAREGTAITVGGELSFLAGRFDLTREVGDIVDTIAEKLAGKPNKIEVRGHSSRDEVPEDPQLDKVQLSYQRARAVADLLVRDGVEQRRLRISAAGAAEPIDDIGDEDSVDHARVTIFVLDTYSQEFVATADAEE
jgi:chemotaxis protein MotB